MKYLTLCLLLAGCATGLDLNQICPFTVNTPAGTVLVQCKVEIEAAVPVDAGAEAQVDADAFDTQDVVEASEVAADVREAAPDVREASPDVRDAAADVRDAVADVRAAEAAPPPPRDGGAARVGTGTGFFVSGGKLFDANGIEFRPRGLNHLHWDAPSVGIYKSGANTERWVLDFGQSAATNAGLLQRSISHGVVPMPGNWNTTCTEDPGALSAAVDTWVAQAARFKPFERSILVNIANEWGPASAGWRDAYITAVQRMRAAGYLGTLVIDSGGCGQDRGDLISFAPAVFAADPEKNLLFDVHLYGFWCTTGCDLSWQFPLASSLDQLKALNLPIVVGEFGPGRNIGPSPTNVTPAEIIAAAEARGFGWLAWAWDDPAGEFTAGGCPPNDNWFALSCTGDFVSSADLTRFGQAIATFWIGPKATVFP